MKTIDLHGVAVPALGFGTWRLNGATCRRAVGEALDAGYRHIDTAAMYGNEDAVGAAIADSGLPREALFVTTKLWMDDLAADRVADAAARSLDRLGLDHVDLLLIHWPSAEVPLAGTLGAMASVQRAGRARLIGVSNFPADLLDRAAAESLLPIACDQVEYHPFLGQRAVLAAARRIGAMVTAYCPLARGRVLDHPVLAEIGRRHGKSAIQVALRWLVQQDRVAAIPKATAPERIRANFDIWDFALDAGETARIDGLAGAGQRFIDPAWAPDWDAA